MLFIQILNNMDLIKYINVIITFLFVINLSYAASLPGSTCDSENYSTTCVSNLLESDDHKIDWFYIKYDSDAYDWLLVSPDGSDVRKISENENPTSDSNWFIFDKLNLNLNVVNNQILGVSQISDTNPSILESDISTKLGELISSGEEINIWFFIQYGNKSFDWLISNGDDIYQFQKPNEDRINRYNSGDSLNTIWKSLPGINELYDLAVDNSINDNFSIVLENTTTINQNETFVSVNISILIPSNCTMETTSRACGSDGNLHILDSCGIENDLLDTCSFGCEGSQGCNYEAKLVKDDISSSLICNNVSTGITNSFKINSIIHWYKDYAQRCPEQEGINYWVDNWKTNMTDYFLDFKDAVDGTVGGTLVSDRKTWNDKYLCNDGDTYISKTNLCKDDSRDNLNTIVLGFNKFERTVDTLCGEVFGETFNLVTMDEINDKCPNNFKIPVAFLGIDVSDYNIESDSFCGICGNNFSVMDYFCKDNYGEKFHFSKNYTQLQNACNNEALVISETSDYMDGYCFSCNWSSENVNNMCQRALGDHFWYDEKSDIREECGDASLIINIDESDSNSCGSCADYDGEGYNDFCKDNFFESYFGANFWFETTIDAFSEECGDENYIVSDKYYENMDGYCGSCIFE